MRATSLVFLIGLALAVPATAQIMAPEGPPDPVEVRNLASNYELTNADATLRCPVALDVKPAGRGLQLSFDRDVCDSRFGFLGEVRAWVPGIAGAILMIAADGRIVTEFTEGVGGVYEAIRENDGVYFFANQQFVDPSERVQIADMYGDWIISRPDGPEICRITLTEKVAGDELLALQIHPECDATIVQAGLSAWQLQRGDVVLRSENDALLRFERNEEKVWMKIPEKPQPLILSRPQ
jgi:hypothetical protein